MNKQYTLAITLLLSCSFGLFACEKSASKKHNQLSNSPASGRRKVRKRHRHGSSENNTIVTYVKGRSPHRYQVSNKKPKEVPPTQEMLAQRELYNVYHSTLWSS